MEFKPIGNETKTIKTKVGEVQFIPTFKENDIVTIIPKYKKYSTEFKKLYGKNFIVDYCKVAELGNMIEEVLYLKVNEEIVITNPYLIKHFKKV